MAAGEPSSKRKVFCSQCKFIEYNGQGHNIWYAGDDFICNHPRNRNSKNDNWLIPDKRGAKNPKELNKKNNCSWFVDKDSGVPNF